MAGTAACGGAGATPYQKSPFARKPGSPSLNCRSLPLWDVSLARGLAGSASEGPLSGRPGPQPGRPPWTRTFVSGSWAAGRWPPAPLTRAARARVTPASPRILSPRAGSPPPEAQSGRACLRGGASPVCPPTTRLQRDPATLGVDSGSCFPGTIGGDSTTSVGLDPPRPSRVSRGLRLSLARGLRAAGPFASGRNAHIFCLLALGWRRRL